jgi:hypothetical protein
MNIQVICPFSEHKVKVHANHCANNWHNFDKTIIYYNNYTPWQYITCLLLKI